MDVVARCPDCGHEDRHPFARCPDCGRAEQSRWWCGACGDWRAAQTCPACSGGLRVPVELFLGQSVVGSAVAFKVVVRNPSKKLVGCTVTCADPAVTIHGPRLLLAPAGTAEVSGRVVLAPGPPGRRTFRLVFESPVPSESLLTVEATTPAPRLEFLPPLVTVRTPNPGSTVRTSVMLKNSGNVPLSAVVTSSVGWLVAGPKWPALAPGESVEVKLRARSKKTDSGTLEAKLTATAEGGSWEATVRYALPAPELTAGPVAFGELRPGHPALADLVVRNTGRVRVQCTLAAAHPWLKVVPTRLSLPPGREKTVRVRAVLTAEQDGPQASEILVVHVGETILRVAVTATGKVPRPLLRPIRKQRVRAAAGTTVERKFQLANDGDGPLDVTASADKSWIQFAAAEVRVGPGKKRKLRYVLDLPALPRGEHAATITLATNAGTVAVPVTVQVLDPNPVLEVFPVPDLSRITPDLPLSVPVLVRNAGIGLLTVRAESESPRATVTPADAEVRAGPPMRFRVAIAVDGLPGGEHEAAVRLTSNGGEHRTVIRFRVPVEQIDVPALIDLGDRAAGRPVSDAVHIRNSGPDRVTLDVRGEGQGLKPDADRVTVHPGETVAVPFRLELPPDVLGPVTGALVLTGRAVRFAVPVRAVARRVELVVRNVVVLGNLVPGEERAFAVDVENTGELTVEVPDTHRSGDLEVWVRPATVCPGQRVVLAGRVRVNAKQPVRALRAEVPLLEGVAVQFVADVVAPKLPKLLAVVAATGGLVTAGALTAAEGSWLGGPLVLLGFVIGLFACLWLFWRDTGG